MCLYSSTDESKAERSSATHSRLEGGKERRREGLFLCIVSTYINFVHVQCTCIHVHVCTFVHCVCTCKNILVHIQSMYDVRVYTYMYCTLQALQKLSNGEVTPKALRDMSGSVLLLVTTTIEHMEEVCATICIYMYMYIHCVNTHCILEWCSTIQF